MDYSGDEGEVGFGVVLFGIGVVFEAEFGVETDGKYRYSDMVDTIW